MSKDDFYTQLKTLENKFNTMQPEVCETVTDGKIEGYVVVWNTDISVGGPLERMGKGGTRVTPKTDLAEIKMLARIMALKNAAAGLPLGGAKSGLKADSSASDFEDTYRKFVSLCAPLLNENGGVFGGFGYDIGARPEMAHWACDELGSLKSFTGKPLDMGGTDYDVEGMAGLGVATAAKVALEYDGRPASGASFSVQGLGAMGAAVVKYFAEHGGILKSVADPKIAGTWYFENGAPEPLIAAFGGGDFDTARELLASSDYTNTDTTEDVLYDDVDVLFPCAVQDVIHIDNVQKIKARHIAEGANNPTSDAARTWLFENNVTVIPDFIANSGGIIAAFVELTSDVTPEENVKNRINPERAKDMTVTRITDNVQTMLKMAQEYGVEPADAGRFMAYKKILI